MAKSSSKSGAGTSRVRFIMLDAEIAEGDVAAVTQAIQNALKPATIVQQRTNGAQTKSLTHESQDNAPNEEDHVQEVIDVSETPEPRQSRPRRIVARTPKVVDIDMNGEVSLATFAKDKDSRSQAKKYLICAAWLKEHRGIDAVTDGHIYTCFKSIGWSTNIPDFGQPLRDLKAKNQYFEKSDKGYEINHLGLDFVKKLSAKGGDE